MSRIISERIPGAPDSPKTTAAVVVAAGQGLRAGQALPKQFVAWRGKPVLRHSVETLVRAGIAPIVVVIPENCETITRDVLRDIADIHLVVGGPTRQESVHLGLKALVGTAPDSVLIHDAARPIVPRPVIDRLLAALMMHKGAIPVLSVVDSLTHAKITGAGEIMAEPARREDLRRVQTPQAFHFPDILAAHSHWRGRTTAGDDAQVARACGMEIALIEGDEALHKLTFVSDFVSSPPVVRIGTGFDVHRLAPGEPLWLCGVEIKHTHGLAGHSDADVAIHALVDAMLGAVCAGDIGQHFPPSDIQWKGARSHRFLSHAGTLVREAGYMLGNADLTIICEAPKIGPHREAMRASLAEILGVDITAISVKATTTEKLGFTGRREGIAAQAVVSLIKVQDLI